MEQRAAAAETRQVKTSTWTTKGTEAGKGGSGRVPLVRSYVCAPAVLCLAHFPVPTNLPFSSQGVFWGRLNPKGELMTAAVGSDGNY